MSLFLAATSVFLAATSTSSMSFLDAIREIAVPIALLISIVMQKLEAIRAKRAAEEATESRQRMDAAAKLLATKLEEQKQAALDAALIVAKKLEEQNEATEAAAREVKAQLHTATVAQQVKMEEIHVDVNSKMGAQKKKTWEFALMLAKRTGDEADLANARLAEKDYLDHIEAQARADERVRMVKEKAAAELGIKP